MAAKPRPPRAGLGRVKGIPNKTTRMLKEAILEAAAKVGADGKGKGELVGYCTRLALDEPRAFSTLLGRVLPMQVVGAGDGPLQVVINRLDSADRAAE